MANHYLALDFSEPYLQDSSWGEPIDKWRKFFNKDLELLNKSIKKYLLNLSELFYKNHIENNYFVSQNQKVLYNYGQRMKHLSQTQVQ